MKANLLPIAKYSWKYIAYTLLAFFVFEILDFDLLEFLAFLLLLTFLYIYRNPEREILYFGANSVLSPVDGTVVLIENIDDDYYTYKVEIESTLFSNGFLRSPMQSSVNSIAVHRGAKLAKIAPLANKINENVVIEFEDKNANRLKVLHRAKENFDDLHVDIKNGEYLYQSKRYGFMTNLTTTLYLPDNFRLDIAKNQELKASESLVGYFS